MEEPAKKSEGFFASLWGLLQTLLAIAHNRLELLLVELQEERVRLFEALLLTAAVAVTGALTLVMISFAIVVVFWEEHRVAVLVGLSAVYLLATLGLFLTPRHRLRNWPALSATLAELEKDKAWWEAKN